MPAILAIKIPFGECPDISELGGFKGRKSRLCHANQPVLAFKHKKIVVLSRD